MDADAPRGSIFDMDNENDKRLSKRRKRQWLTNAEKNYLIGLLGSNSEDKEVILSTYNLSKSTYYRLAKGSENFKANLVEPEDEDLSRKFLQENEKKIIEALITPPQKPLTIKSIKKSVESSVGRGLDEGQIRRFIKNDLKYLYKKGSSRPAKIRSNPNIYSKSLFCVKILSELHRGRLIVNVDECGFTRSVKTEYSWLPRGKNQV
jgi:hypothetical protein